MVHSQEFNIFRNVKSQMNPKMNDIYITEVYKDDEEFNHNLIPNHQRIF